MRTLTAATKTEIERDITRPIYLVELVMATVTYRLSTGPAVSWNGSTWSQSGAQVDDLRAVSGGAQEGRISLPNHDNAASALVLSDGVAGRACRIWQLYGDGPYATNDAVLLFDGECDGADLTIERVSIDLTSSGRIRELSPRLYWEHFCKHIPPAGTVISWGGEHYRLERRG